MLHLSFPCHSCTTLLIHRAYDHTTPLPRVINPYTQLCHSCTIPHSVSDLCTTQQFFHMSITHNYTLDIDSSSFLHHSCIIFLLLSFMQLTLHQVNCRKHQYQSLGGITSKIFCCRKQQQV